jgi:hypothetical protein
MRGSIPLMRARARLSLLSIVAFSACMDATASVSVPTPPALRSVEVDSVTIGARLRVSVAAAALVRVTYSAGPDEPTLQMERALTSEDGAVVLERLLHGRTYGFSARAVSASGVEGPATAGSFTTPPLPDDLASEQFEATGSPSESLLMLDLIGKSGFTGFAAVDDRGQVVWYWRTVGPPQGWTRRANGNFVLNDLGNGLREISPNGDLVRRLDFDYFGPTPHHDLIATPQNTILFISQDFRTPAGSPTIWGDAIYEWTPESSALVKRWTAWDWFNPATDWSDVSTPLDWLHANSLALGPHGNILLSLNWLSQVVSIAPDWSHLEWRLGGNGSSFAIDSAAAFSGQHSVTMPLEGHVLMFDNGRERADGAQNSRALELVLDTVARTATKYWSFEPVVRAWAPYVGLARRLTNGNTTVFFGLPSGYRGATGPVASYEVQPDATVRWSLIIGNVTSVYRGVPMTSIAGETVVR